MKRNLYKSLFLIVSTVLLFSAAASAQKRQAFVLIGQGGSGTSGCDGMEEINTQIWQNLKLNKEDEVRLLVTVGASRTGNARTADAIGAIEVDRSTYEKAVKAKIMNLYKLFWKEGILYAIQGPGQEPMVALPDDMKPSGGRPMAVRSFYTVVFGGERREGKNNIKSNFALKDFQKMYFMSEGSNVNDLLFDHAKEEARVGLWEAYLRASSNHRKADAEVYMRSSIIECSRASLKEFKDGNYPALDVARTRAERAQGINDDTSVRQLLGEIGSERQRVNAIRDNVVQLINSGKWDDALRVAEGIAIYLDSWPEVKGLYAKANEESYKLHLALGRQALEAKQIDTAKSECEIALGRKPGDSSALGCACTARDRIALRDSSALRSRKQPKDAMELLEARTADSSCPTDETVAKELTLTKCEYKEQLFEEAKRLTSGAAAPRPGRRAAPAAGLKGLSFQNKDDFRTARDNLILGGQLCPDDKVASLLDKVNASLSEYAVTEARKAGARGDVGTAYVYLSTALMYTPNSENVTMLHNQAREQFEAKTRVNIGVAISDRSNSGYAGDFINSIRSAIEGNAVRSGLQQPNILDEREAAAALRRINSGAPVSESYAIFSGELISAFVNTNRNRRYVQSSYQEENPEWRRRDATYQYWEKEHDRCANTYGKENCTQLKQKELEAKSYRDSVLRTLTYNYNFTQVDIGVAGTSKMSLRFSDSISRKSTAAETLVATVADNCTENYGVNERDYRYKNVSCTIPPDGQYMGRMLSQLQSDASRISGFVLSALPGNYLRRAQTAANRQSSVEDYIRFLFMTQNKSGSDADEARRFLVSVDKELLTDGKMR